MTLNCRRRASSGDEVAVLVYDTYRDEGDILAVGGDARAVSDELKVMGTTCGADDLLGDSLTRLVVDDDLDFAWLVLCIHPHQAVALLTGEGLLALLVLRSIDGDARILLLATWLLPLMKSSASGVVGVHEDGGLPGLAASHVQWGRM